MQSNLNKKILDKNNVAKVCSDLRTIGVKVVFTNGCFDILHAGHVDYMEKAKKLGDVLFVGVNSDSSIKRIKGPKRPIVEEKYRVDALKGLSSVDYVCTFDEETPESLIRIVKPQVLVKGKDWSDKKIAGQDFVLSYNGKVEFIDLVEGISTSIIIDKILKSK